MQKYVQIARILTGDASATAGDGVDWVLQLAAEFGIPRLGIYQIEWRDFPAIVSSAMKASSMKANPVVLDEAVLMGILEQAW